MNWVLRHKRNIIIGIGVGWLLYLNDYFVEGVLGFDTSKVLMGVAIAIIYIGWKLNETGEVKKEKPDTEFHIIPDTYTPQEGLEDDFDILKEQK